MGRFRIYCCTAVVLSGCAGVDPSPDLAPLRAAIGDRTGGDVALAPDEARVRALTSGTLTMDGAVQVALLASPALQARYAEVGIAKADMAEAAAYVNPRVDIMVRPTTNPAELANLEFGLVQSIADVITQPRRARAADAAFAAANLRIAADVVGDVGEIRKAYVEAVAARHLLAMKRYTATATEAAAELAQEMHKAGNLTDLELSREQAAHADAEADVEKAELTVAERAPELARLLGSLEPLRLPETLPAPPPADVEVNAIDRRLDLAALRGSVTAARAGLQAKVGWRGWQEIELGVSAERDGDGQWALGPNLSFALPIINRGGPIAARAASEVLKAEKELAAGEARAHAEVATAQARVTSARRLIDRYAKVILPLKQKIVQLEQQNQNYMIVGVFDVLAAKRDEIAAQADYVEALRDYWLARVDLANAIGGAAVAMPVASGESS